MTDRPPPDADTIPDHDSVNARGFTLLHDIDVEDDNALLLAASRFGNVSAVGNGNPPRLIAEVQPKPDQSAAALGSQRAGVFPLHTDSTGYPRPHDVVILACVADDEDGGGESLLLPLDDLLATIPAPILSTLTSRALRFRPAVGRNERWLRAPILEQRDDEYRVRYRQDQIDIMPDIAEQALNEWENQIRQATPEKILLSPGQALVIDNMRMLHGRTYFSLPTRRHLRRLKLYYDPAREGPAGPASLW